MELELVRSLFDYNRWVNRRLLEVAEELPVERQREHFGGSFDTIHGTAAHILSAEMHYRARWTDEPRTELGLDQLPGVREMRPVWEEHQARLDRFAEALTAERLAGPLRWVGRDGSSYELPLWKFLLQMVNHGTHHRAELADMLTRVGSPPPPTDIIVYFREQR